MSASFIQCEVDKVLERIRILILSNLPGLCRAIVTLAQMYRRRIFIGRKAAPRLEERERVNAEIVAPARWYLRAYR